MQRDQDLNDSSKEEEKKDNDEEAGDLPKKPKTPDQSLRAEKLRLAPGSDRNMLAASSSVSTRLSFTSTTPEKAAAARIPSVMSSDASTTPEKATRLPSLGSERLRMAPGSVLMDENGSMENTPEKPSLAVPNPYTQRGAVRIGDASNNSNERDIENNLLEAEVVSNMDINVESMQEELQRLRGSLEAMREEQRRNQEAQQQWDNDEPKAVVIATVEERDDRGCNKTLWIVVVVLLIVAGAVAGVFLSGVTDKKEAVVPPILVASEAPTSTGTSVPTLSPTEDPSTAPSLAPTIAPTPSPTQAPAPAPTLAPSGSSAPSSLPSYHPTNLPTPDLTPVSTPMPSFGPTNKQTTSIPSTLPTPAPSLFQTATPTVSPTVASLESLLADYGPLNLEAITWLQFNTWQPNLNGSAGVYQIFERYALASLYFSANGTAWSQTDNWMSTSEPVCRWFSRQSTNLCEGPLTSLNLASNGLQGTIPPALFGLTALTQLDLSANQLTGSIPETLGAMGENLLELRLQSNQLSGPIPEIWQLSNLEWLYLQDNQLSGSVPSLPFIDFGCYLDGNCFSDITKVEVATGSCNVTNNCN